MERTNTKGQIIIPKEEKVVTLLQIIKRGSSYNVRLSLSELYNYVPWEYFGDRKTLSNMIRNMVFALNFEPETRKMGQYRLKPYQNWIISYEDFDRTFGKADYHKPKSRSAIMNKMKGHHFKGLYYVPKVLDRQCSADEYMEVNFQLLTEAGMQIMSQSFVSNYGKYNIVPKEVGDYGRFRTLYPDLFIDWLMVHTNDIKYTSGSHYIDKLLEERMKLLNEQYKNYLEDKETSDDL